MHLLNSTITSLPKINSSWLLLEQNNYYPTTDCYDLPFYFTKFIQSCLLNRISIPFFSVFPITGRRFTVIMHHLAPFLNYLLLHLKFHCSFLFWSFLDNPSSSGNAKFIFSSYLTMEECWPDSLVLQSHSQRCHNQPGLSLLFLCYHPEPSILHNRLDLAQTTTSYYECT